MSYPIILAHGIARLDELLNVTFRYDDAPDDRFNYFKGIRSTLEDAGFLAYHSGVPWAASVTLRARALKQNVLQILAKTGAPKVNIIAHSMGGLDARHMLFDSQSERLHTKVGAVVTIGTPHLGMSFADFGVQRYRLAITVFNSLGLDLEGFEDLTTDACGKFNEMAANFEATCGVVFRTLAGVQTLSATFFPLKLSWAYINDHEGANDGLVPLSSARWKDEYFKQQIVADHLNEIGWWDPDDVREGESPGELESRIRQLYVAIATDLPG